jgi:hypothetical protein
VRSGQHAKAAYWLSRTLASLDGERARRHRRQDPLGNAMPVATAALQSLWQHNMQALKVTRAFGAELLRTTGVVVITAVNYATGNSPA